jgi:glycosyltransferase involved in cell wall biosynthesis
MKVAFVSESLPPAKTGQALVLSRLLGGWGPSDYCLLSALAPGEGEAGALPAKTYRLGALPLLGRGYRYGLSHLRESVDVARGVRARAAEVGEVLRRERCDAVVACTGDMLDIPAACLAARRLRVPFYAYVFDHYSYREWMNPARRFWAARMEPWVLRRAARVIVPNEVLRDDLRRRLAVEPAVIYNSFDPAPYAGLDGGAPAGGGGRIVYTGDIYEAHHDAFRNLLDALERPGLEGLSLHAYTPRTAEELARAGVRGGRLVLHEPRSPAEIPAIQRGAGLLFLPLAFKSPYPELVRTSATTKMGEYMAARRPVLVHAPEGSFVSWYFREHGCGVVVDRDDPAELARALAGVLADEGLRRELVERAWGRVHSDFRIESARAKFMEVLSEGRGPGGAGA